jgi:hypothetical protein
MMMIIRKLLAAYLAAVTLFALTGCQLRLAREDAGQADTRDKLIGVFITEEYLDLFDMEGYLNDNISKISDSGQITVDGSRSKYQGHLYATLETRALTNEDTGEKVERREYVFDSIEGISYFSVIVPATDNNDSYTSFHSNGGISERHSGLHLGDDENKTTMEGTIYMSPNQPNITRYINPVYQSSDGSVYAISGSGISAGGIQQEGAVYSQALEETRTITENNKSKTESVSIKISFAIMLPPEQIVVLQMDRDSAVLSRNKYIPGELPDKLTPETETEYIIAESYKHDHEGNPVIIRSLFDKSSENIETFHCREDGICIKQQTHVDWNR